MDRFSRSCVDLESLRPRKKNRGLFGLFGKKHIDARAKIHGGFNNIPLHASGVHVSPSAVHRRTEKSGVFTRKRVVFSTLIIFFIGWIVLILYLPFFRVTKVNVSGLHLIDRNEIQSYLENTYISSGIWPKNNYFLIRPAKIATAISNKYAVNAVEVKKIFSHELQINIEEKITSIIYDNGWGYYLLDGEGTVVKILSMSADATKALPVTSSPDATTTTAYDNDFKATTTTVAVDNHKPDYLKFVSEYYGLPIIYDARRLNVHDRQEKVLSADLIKSLIDWKTAIREAEAGEVNYYESDNPTAGITAVLTEPWKILFQPSNDMNEQITNLKTILANKDVNPNEYVDLRFGERVFWK